MKETTGRPWCKGNNNNIKTDLKNVEWERERERERGE
jgi:hypothetical protein